MSMCLSMGEIYTVTWYKGHYIELSHSKENQRPPLERGYFKIVFAFRHFPTIVGLTITIGVSLKVCTICM